ncbi:hypothetical protein OV203_45590 [Nannocystis sp. ILAH1]|uniref:hypothetical protein n=1 Tax=unclassified Nannocystis TaxID=2627009 RepID=UPI00226FD314|nr:MULTISPECIES: hypothetical protein [unclassified Nannocystis]MCY0994483.1 hypothetical protein [Nannocystis sp. ILAH1]MCY1063569.1 hypothetical protein [Nannocystis sp. RBIL2]
MRVASVVLAALALSSCAPAARGPEAPRSEPQAAVRPPPAPRPPPSPTYEALDGRFHHYAVTRIEALEDHFVATFHDSEGATCDLSASDALGVRVRGCGFPATLMDGDQVPADRQRLLPALRAAVLAEAPRATLLRVRYEGTYRVVHLEEEVPCDGEHGRGYNRVELRYDATLSALREVRYLGGSACGAARFYWASPDPVWLSFTSTRPLLSPAEVKSALPPDLTAALQAVLAGR